MSQFYLMFLSVPERLMIQGIEATCIHSSAKDPIPVFRGLRVRMGIHSGIAERVKIHELTKRYVYSGDVRPDPPNIREYDMVIVFLFVNVPDGKLDDRHCGRWRRRPRLFRMRRAAVRSSCLARLWPRWSRCRSCRQWYERIAAVAAAF